MRTSTRDLVRVAATIVVTAALVAMMVPVASQAAGTLMTIVDADTNAKVQVENGRLRVGDGTGPLSVDGTVRVRDGGGPLTVDGRVEVSDAARSPINRYLWNSSAGTASLSSPPYVVPEDLMLVVTHASGRLDVVPGALVNGLYVNVDPATGPAIGHRVVPELMNTDSFRDFYAWQLSGELRCDGGCSIWVSAWTTSGDHIKFVDMTFSGYVT